MMIDIGLLLIASGLMIIGSGVFICIAIVTGALLYFRRKGKEYGEWQKWL